MTTYLSNPAVFCAAGKTADDFFDSLILKNQSQIVKTDVYGKSFFAAKIPNALPSTLDKFDSHCLRILNSCLLQILPAVEKAKSLYGKNRIGVCLGSCDNGSERSLLAHKAFFENGAFPREYSIREQGAEYFASFASKILDVCGVSLAFSTACSSSASALLVAKELILSGECDAVVAGGVDVASQTALLGFDSLGAISQKITNPMSANRSGITLGDGAAFFVLSRDDLEKTNIALFGAGESSDANHMTSPKEDGSGAASAMENAILNAKIDKSKIGYINLHATGTILNDAMESRAVKTVFGESPVFVSGTKPITGHTLGAAGALELAACFLSMKKNKLPPHVWDGVTDEKIPLLNFVKSGENAKIDFCMSNTFAFGGCNVSLIIGNAL